jgi:tRNA(Arg) A34 adenosine deaminase TadA
MRCKFIAVMLSCLMMCSGAFAMSKTEKILIGSALLVAGIFAISEGNRYQKTSEGTQTITNHTLVDGKYTVTVLPVKWESYGRNDGEIYGGVLSSVLGFLFLANVEF